MTTRNIVPRADGEGSIGTASKAWGAVRADVLYTDSILASDSGTALRAEVAKTADYTATTSDGIIWADATSNDVTITLPTAVGCAGREYIIKRTDDTEDYDVDVYASENIDGYTTWDLKHQYSVLHVVSNGTVWYNIAENLEPDLVVNSMQIGTGVTRVVKTGEYVDIYTRATEFTVEGTLIVEGSFCFETMDAKTLVRRLI